MTGGAVNSDAGIASDLSPAKPQSGEADRTLWFASSTSLTCQWTSTGLLQLCQQRRFDKQLKNRIDATANGWMESSAPAELPVAGKALAMPPQGAAVPSTTPRILVEAEEQAQSGFDPDRDLKGIAAARPDVTLQIVDGMDLRIQLPLAMSFNAIKR